MSERLSKTQEFNPEERRQFGKFFDALSYLNFERSQVNFRRLRKYLDSHNSKNSKDYAKALRAIADELDKGQKE